MNKHNAKILVKGFICGVLSFWIPCLIFGPFLKVDEIPAYIGIPLLFTCVISIAIGVILSVSYTVDNWDDKL